MSRPLGDFSIAFLRALEDGPATRAELYKRLEGNRESIKSCCTRFQVYGYIESENAEGIRGGALRFKITDKGRDAIAGAAQPNDATDSLRDRAMRLIRRASMGRDSAELAELLGSTRDQVEDALEADVKSHLLSTCLVVRGELQCTLYRISMAGASTLRDARAPAAPDGVAHARAASTPTELSKASAENVIAIAGPVQAKESVREIIAVETRRKVAPAAQPSPPIQGREATLIAIDESSADNFVCYLQSDGVLSIVSAGRSLDLPAEHALKLSGYLHHVRSIRMLSEIVTRGQS